MLRNAQRFLTATVVANLKKQNCKQKMTEEEIYNKANSVVGLGGMTVNERLYVSGLMDLFDKAKKKDRELARTILEAIRVDQPSIKKILKI